MVRWRACIVCDCRVTTQTTKSKEKTTTTKASKAAKPATTTSDGKGKRKRADSDTDGDSDGARPTRVFKSKGNPKVAEQPKSTGAATAPCCYCKEAVTTDLSETRDTTCKDGKIAKVHVAAECATCKAVMHRGPFCAVKIPKRWDNVANRYYCPAHSPFAQPKAGDSVSQLSPALSAVASTATAPVPIPPLESVAPSLPPQHVVATVAPAAAEAVVATAEAATPDASKAEKHAAASVAAAAAAVSALADAPLPQPSQQQPQSVTQPLTQPQCTAPVVAAAAAAVVNVSPQPQPQKQQQQQPPTVAALWSTFESVVPLRAFMGDITRATGYFRESFDHLAKAVEAPEWEKQCMASQFMCHTSQFRVLLQTAVDFLVHGPDGHIYGDTCIRRLRRMCESCVRGDALKNYRDVTTVMDGYTPNPATVVINGAAARPRFEQPVTVLNPGAPSKAVVSFVVASSECIAAECPCLSGFMDNAFQVLLGIFAAVNAGRAPALVLGVVERLSQLKKFLDQAESDLLCILKLPSLAPRLCWEGDFPTPLGDLPHYVLHTDESSSV